MVKQVIIMRKDLKMRRGKEIAQGSHSVLAFLTNRLYSDNGVVFACTLSPAEQEWIDGQFTKITLQVNSEAELMDVYEKAKAAGLETNLITDAGKTEFAGIPTRTCLAIGPDYSEKIDPITAHLSLY